MNIFRQSKKVFFLSCIILCLQGYKPVDVPQKKYGVLSQKKRLFKDVGCQYISGLKVEYSDIDKLNPMTSSYYMSDKKNIDNLTKKYKNFIAKKRVAPVYLTWISDKVGYGVYASKNIKTGDFIAEYTGVLRPLKDHDNLDYAWHYALTTLDNKTLIIDGKSLGNEMRFVNHTANPNTIVITVFGDDDRLHMAYVAIKDIPKDSQLTVDYGSNYWTSRHIKPESY